jgi:hypothetical protein
MQDGTNEPPAKIAPLAIHPAAQWRNAIWLAVGGVVGLAVGVVTTTSVFTTYRFLTPTLPLPAERDPVQILTELNELRQQVNHLNDAKKLQARESDAARRQELTALTSLIQARAHGAHAASPPAGKPGMAAGGSPVRPAHDPFAELDAEIKNLEDTQKILNTILDLVLPAAKEPEKDRRAAPASPH